MAYQPHHLPPPQTNYDGSQVTPLHNLSSAQMDKNDNDPPPPLYQKPDSVNHNVRSNVTAHNGICSGCHTLGHTTLHALAAMAHWFIGDIHLMV